MARKIRTILELDNGNFRRGIQQADRDVDKLQKNFVKMAKLTTAALLGVGAAITGIVVKQTALGAAIEDTSQKLGVSTGFLQEFRYAAEQIGVSTQTADMALQRFTRRSAEAAKGTGEAKDALRQLGVQLTDNNGKMRSTEDMLSDVADGLMRTEGEAQQLRLAFKLFDSEGVALVNMLRNGSVGLDDFRRRARELGLVISDSAIKNMKAFDDSMTDVRRAVSTLAAEFAGSLAPQLKLLAETTLIASDANKELARTLGTGLGEAIRATAAAVKFMVGWWRELITIGQIYLGLKIFGAMTSLGAAMWKTTQTVMANAKATMVAAAATSGVARASLIATAATGTLTKSVGLLRVAFAALFGPVGLTIAILTSAALGLTVFKDKTLELGDTTTTIGETIQAVWWKVKDTVGKALKAITGLFKKSQDDIIEEIDGGIESSYADVMIKVINVIKKGINTAIGLWLGLTTTIVNAAISWPGIFMAAFNSLGLVINEFTTRAKNQFKELFDYIVSFGGNDITNVFSGMFGAMGDTIEREFAGVMPQGVNWGELLGRDYLGETADFIKNQLGDIVEEYRESKNAIEQIGDLSEIAPQGKKVEKSTFVDKGLEDSLARIRAAHEATKRQLSQNLELSRTFNETQRQILQERFDIENRYYAAVSEARIKFGNMSDGELEKELERIRKQTELEKELHNKLIPDREAIAETQRSFAEGWSNALGRFSEQVSDEAQYAQRIFDTMTQGFTDAIMTFVETGKLSFKDLFKSLLQEIVKLHANKMFLALFGAGGPGGGLGSMLGGLFGGGRAKGGSIIGGRAYMVGEKGPEMIVPSGSGTVVPNDMLGGGGQQVTYNINAVDAMSFKQLVSRDPEFIHAVSQRGARRLPR